MTTENNETKTEEQTPSWFIDEGIPGTGDRPAWLPEKYKTAAQLGKHVQELEKRLGTVPEDYDLSKSKFLDPDYEPFDQLKKIAKEKRVPQEVFDAMLQSVDKYMEEFSTDYSSELQKLGDNGQERVTKLDNWAKANLTKEAYEALSNTIRTADQIKALEELRGKMMAENTQVPSGNTGQITNPATVDEVQKEIGLNLQKFKTDENYRKDVQKRLEVAVKNSPGYVDKIGA